MQGTDVRRLSVKLVRDLERAALAGDGVTACLLEARQEWGELWHQRV